MDAFTLSLSLSRGAPHSLDKSAHKPINPANKVSSKDLQERIDELLAWHRIYYSINAHHPLDVRYLDNHFYYQDLLPYLNPASYQAAFSDKNYYDIIFSSFKTPRTLLKRIKGAYYARESKTLDSSALDSHGLGSKTHTILDSASALALLRSYDRVLIKPTEMHATGQGSGIQIIEPASMSERDLRMLLDSYTSDIAIQEVIKQHSFLESLQPNSVNTFRIMTLLYGGGVHLLSAVLAIGSGGDISNGDHSNRIGIDEHGVLRDFLVKDSFILKSPAAPDEDNKAESIFNTKVPHFDKIVATAKAMHLVVPHFGIIGWDFTLDSSGEPVMIEANLDCPSGDMPQFCNPPLLGDRTDTILQDMLRN